MSLFGRWLGLMSGLHHAASLSVFIIGAWWWRNFWLRDNLSDLVDDRFYFQNHFIFLPLMLALIAWLLSGLRGLTGLAHNANFIWALLLMIFVLWARVSYGADVLKPDVALWMTSQLILVALFALSILANSPRPSWIIGALLIGMTIQALLSIAQSSLQSDLGLSVIDKTLGLGLNLRELRLDPQESGVSVVIGRGLRYLRPYGLSAHPNLMSGALVMGLCALISLWSARRWRPYAAALWTLGLWALLLSFSRAALGGLGLGLICGLTLLGLSAWRHKTLADFKRASLALILTSLIVALIFIGQYSAFWGQRFGIDQSATPTLQDHSAASRAVYQEQAAKLMQQYRWRGVGMGNFAWHSALMLRYDWRDLRGDHVHNVYILAAVETGLIGLALYVLSIGSGLLLILKRAYDGRLSAAKIGLAAGCIAWLGIAWFDHYAWTQLGHMLIFWGALAAALHHENQSPRFQQQSLDGAIV